MSRDAVHLHPWQVGIDNLKANVEGFEECPGLEYMGDLCPFPCTVQAGQVATAGGTDRVGSHPSHVVARVHIEVASKAVKH